VGDPFAGANLDLTEVDRALDLVGDRGKRLLPAFRDLRRPLRSDQKEHAKGERGPNGSWPPRSPVTEARRKARNRGRRQTKAMKLIAPGKAKRRQSTPKRILGRLPAAVIYTIGDKFIRGVSRVPWSGVHQQGGTVGRGSRIPARPFLWLSDRMLEVARATFAKYVLKSWKGWKG
jgi:phage gpG-like protein